MQCNKNILNTILTSFVIRTYNDFICTGRNVAWNALVISYWWIHNPHEINIMSMRADIWEMSRRLCRYMSICLANVQNLPFDQRQGETILSIDNIIECVRVYACFQYHTHCTLYVYALPYSKMSMWIYV